MEEEAWEEREAKIRDAILLEAMNKTLAEFKARELKTELAKAKEEVVEKFKAEELLRLLDE